ncbi:immunity protein Imm33 domain-containing protein [Oceanospirillum beijerinckii]|uniref:immunity protein Imm33 domain-containing protein n=1 Tax=Oceanospirillum beijerinckii TaxID=64976 RepID=UPI000489B935|nr:hypothetical protein [Oceanospirillum beijerinckii]
MKHTTNKLHQYNHPEFQFSYDEKSIPQQDIDWFSRYLEDQVKNGATFKDGETIQLGCMILKIDLIKNNYLKLSEPNMKEIPIKFIDSISNSIKIIRQQQDTINSITKINIDFSSIRESIIVSDSFNSANNFYMNKEEKEAHRSGWFFRDINNAEENYREISICEFIINRPDLAKYLAMPVGIGILSRDNDIIRVIKDEVEQDIIPGSFLDIINSAR